MADSQSPAGPRDGMPPSYKRGPIMSPEDSLRPGTHEDHGRPASGNWKNLTSDLRSDRANPTQWVLVIAVIGAVLLLVFGGAALFHWAPDVAASVVEGLVLVIILPLVYLWRKGREYARMDRRERQYRTLGLALGSLAAFLGYAIIYCLALVVLALFSPGIWGTKTFEPLPGFSSTSLLCAIPLFAIVGIVSANRLRPAIPEESVSLGPYYRSHVIRSFVIGALLSLPCQFLLLIAAAF